MKLNLILYLLFFTIILRLDLMSQQYQPLIRGDTYWDVMKVNSWAMCYYYDGGRYYFEGDTILDGRIYSIVKRFPILSYGTGDFCPPYAVDVSSSQIVTYMREDTIAKKVFIYDEFFGDALLYDFSLAVGDTLFSPLTSPMIVDSTSYVTLLNGEQRKIFHFYNYSHVYYIESLGGSSGLCYPVTTYIDYWTEPGCVKENGVSLFNWENTHDIDCYPYVGLNVFRESERSVLYPNPVKRSIGYINFTTSEIPFKIMIKDIHGRLIDHFDVDSSQPLGQIRLQIENLDSGIYFIELLTINKHYYYEKLIIIN